MKYILLLISLVFSLQGLNGQTNRPYRYYSTQKVQARLLKEDAKMAKTQSKIERHIANFKLVGQIKEVTIPVVFHVLHNQATERISEEQIYSQLEALNESFIVSLIAEADKHPADIAEDFGKHVPDQLGIQFCLADIKQGNKDAINYVSTNVSEWGNDDAIKDKKTKGIAPIQPDKYLNVWIGNLVDSVSGYAQMPGGADKTDGIVIDYEFFGTMGTAKEPYHLGKTLTHLVGSYLGLYELWSEKTLCGDDYVNDTPIHNAPNQGPTHYYRHISLCFDGDVEMSMNYMDNSDDAFIYMFTVGQMLRMQANLTRGGVRHQLTNSNSRCLEEENLGELIPNYSKFETTTNTFSDPNLTVYPNPVSNTLQIGIPQLNGNFSMVIYNSIGQIMHLENNEQTEKGQTITLNVKAWESGIYFIHAKLGMKNKSYRFMVTK